MPLVLWSTHTCHKMIRLQVTFHLLVLGFSNFTPGVPFFQDIQWRFPKATGLALGPGGLLVTHPTKNLPGRAAGDHQ